MRRIATALATALCLTTQSARADVLGAYYMSVHPQDLVNSSGAPLRDPAQVLQQDRANYHRFGRPGPSDESDSFFGNRAMRAQIPALFAADPRNRTLYAGALTTPGRANFADWLILVCGQGGRVTSILVDYADGDGNQDCP